MSSSNERKQLDASQINNLAPQNPTFFAHPGGGEAATICVHDFASWVEIFEYRQSDHVRRFLRDYHRFPPTLAGDVSDLHQKCWMVSYARQNLLEVQEGTRFLKWFLQTVGENMPQFIATISRLRAGQMVWITLEPKIAVHFIESFLFQLKAALDLLAPLLGKWLGVNSFIKGFNKEGDDFGGRFLKILGGVVGDSKPQAEQLIAVFKKHKAEWLDEAVHLRDDITHGSTFNRHLVLECCQRVEKSPVLEIELKLEYKGKSLLGTIRKFDGGFQSLIAEAIGPLKVPPEGKETSPDL
jgi:hypothetical protein